MGTMGTTSTPTRFALATAAALALVVVACESASSSSDPMTAVRAPCPPQGCATPPPMPLILENRSAGKVDVVLRGAPKLRLDERVADGTLTVPIPDATLGEEVRLALDDRQTANLGTEIEIVATANSAIPAYEGLPGVTDDAPRAAWIATVKRVP